ncbi:MAG: TetR family transcriptional regulator [Pseudonocardiaceae bacterium]|nr:TetR family transcriptional regulator [Pseudonocardiaceae bacterium]
MAQAGRRPGSTNTREQILAAARNQFAEKGYDGATIRGIAAEAGVNAAMVHHYFGSKEQVFASVMRFPMNPHEVIGEVLSGPRDEVGERMVRLYLRLWQEPESRAMFLGLVRSVTTTEQTAALVREFIEQVLFVRISETLGVPRFRISGALSQLVGMAMARYVLRVEPMASADDDEIVAMIAPVIQSYLTASST